MQRYVIQSAYKTLQVLLTFSQAPHRYTLAELADRVEMDKNQIFRALKTLEYAGFLRSEPDGSLILTPLVQGLANGNHEAISLPRIASRYIQKLFEQVEETVGLFSYDGEHRVCVDLLESSKSIRWSCNVGRHFLLHAGAGSKVILSYLEPDIQKIFLQNLPSLPKFTTHTITEPQVMRREMRRIQERGYAISYGEFDSETHAVAAAIFNSAGKVIGSVTVAGPAYRLDQERVQIFGHLVMETAHGISLEIGFRP